MFSNYEKSSFTGVAMLFIVFGIIIFVVGALGWYVNVLQQQSIMNFPFAKIIGGLTLMALGYIQLELDLIRRKK